ncbi:MAG: hypothetical protein AAGB25_03855, partial [Pseudomonadota bacterium]
MTGHLRGELWPQDRWGRVLNAGVDSSQLSQAAWLLGEEAADLASERFEQKLHSVYLSGPAARGRAGGAAAFVLLRLGETGLASGAWATAAAAELRRRHPDIGPTSISVFRWRDVFSTDGAFSPARFRLGVNSVCVAGRDVGRLIAPQRLDDAASNPAIIAFQSRMWGAAKKAGAAARPARVRAAAMDAGHAVLAAGFSMVMSAEQAYSEDLDLRRDFFALAHPDHKGAIHQAYNMAVRPVDDPRAVLTFIESICKWMSP